MTTYECKILQEEEMCRIYREQMPHDFAEDEIKPLELMLDMLQEGTYEPLGLYRNGEVCGYAFFIRKDDWLLLDYYSILPEWRNQGIGGIFLKQFRRFYQPCAGILLEVERPEMAENVQERRIREHRIRFYQRNHIRLTSLKVRLFGVPFFIMAMPLQEDPKEALWKDELDLLYHAMLPGPLYRENVEWDQ